MQVVRLHPDPALVSAEDALRGLDLRGSLAPGRSHVAVNMVASVDGRTAVDGRSSPLTSPFDRALFHALRAEADAILVGSRTLAAERYGPLVKAPDRRAAREARGLAPSPVACVITRSGDLDLDVSLFQDPDSEVIVLTGKALDTSRARARLAVHQLNAAELEPEAVMERLRAEHGAAVVLCEGGATLNGALLRAGAVDELFLSVAPFLHGGPDPLTLFAGELPAPVSLEMTSAMESGDTLFLRYRVTRA